MADWISLDSEKFVNERVEQLSGVDATVSPSAYDVPTAYRVTGTSTPGQFEIEFKYFGEREGDRLEEEIKLDQDVSFFVARRSGRILRIRAALAPASMSLRERKAKLVRTLGTSFAELEHAHHSPSRPENYRFTKSFIAENSGDIWNNSRDLRFAGAR